MACYPDPACPALCVSFRCTECLFCCPDPRERGVCCGWTPMAPGVGRVRVHCTGAAGQQRQEEEGPWNGPAGCSAWQAARTRMQGEEVNRKERSGSMNQWNCCRMSGRGREKTPYGGEPVERGPQSGRG